MFIGFQECRFVSFCLVASSRSDEECQSDMTMGKGKHSFSFLNSCASEGKGWRKGRIKDKTGPWKREQKKCLPTVNEKQKGKLEKKKEEGKKMGGKTTRRKRKMAEKMMMTG